jgi:hypothetical protein
VAGGMMDRDEKHNLKIQTNLDEAYMGRWYNYI